MNYKLNIIYGNGDKETCVYPTEEIALEHMDKLNAKLGLQGQFTCVTPTVEDVGKTEYVSALEEPRMMFYQVNTFDYETFGSPHIEEAPVMITMDINKAIRKGNELIEKGMNTEIVTWVSEEELDSVASVFTDDDEKFDDNGNGIVVTVEKGE